MLRPSLIACSACACHVRVDEEACPHCDAPLWTKSSTDVRSIKRAAVAVSLGLAVSAAALAACDDTSGTGGAGGATTNASTSSASSTKTSSSDSSAVAAYGAASTVGSTGTN